MSYDNDPDHGYDVHGPGGYWEGPTTWEIAVTGLLIFAALCGFLIGNLVGISTAHKVQREIDAK